MSSRWKTLLIMTALLFLTLPGAVRAQAFPADVSTTLQDQPPPELCEHYLGRFFAEDGWRETLINPVFTNEEQLRERYNLYLPVHDCLESSAVPLTSEQDEARKLTGYFVTLVGGILSPLEGQAGQGALVQFSNLPDPAILALRDEVGLPVPEGYLYVWLYPSSETLPENLQPFFENPQVRGLTLFTRYIIVLDTLTRLDEEQRGTRLEDYQRGLRERVLSHEYVHAYIKSLLGTERAFSLPEWFDEGLAIYFSGSSEPSSQFFIDDSGRQVWITTPVEEYARYRDIFKYLEAQHGRARFLTLIRQSVMEADPDLLYRDLDVQNEQDVFVLAETSRQEQGLRRLAYIVVSLFVATLLLTIVPRLVRLRHGEPVEETPPGEVLPQSVPRSVRTTTPQVAQSRAARLPASAAPSSRVRSPVGSHPARTPAILTPTRVAARGMSNLAPSSSDLPAASPAASSALPPSGPPAAAGLPAASQVPRPAADSSPAKPGSPSQRVSPPLPAPQPPADRTAAAGQTVKPASGAQRAAPPSGTTQGIAPVAPLSAIYKGARGDLRGVERILLQGSHSVETDAVQARLAAVEALEQLNDYRSVDLLIAALRRDASSSVRSAAARALGEKGDLRRRDAPLDTLTRNRALGALFPAIHQDPTDEVRMQAVEAAYKVGGSAVLQPVKSSLRRQVRAGQMPPAVQHWLVEWGVKSRLEELLIDLYPWMDLEARRSIVEHLRWHLTPSILEQLGLALSSGDPHMQELARAVLNGDPLSG